MGFIALQRAKLHYVFENIFHVVERLVSEKEAKMNKIFKVIWSKSKQCYVVVSELAKNTTGKKKIVVASIFAAMVAGQAMQVDATSGSFYDTGAIKGAIAIGKAGSTAPQATDENAIAIGQAARANGRGGVALGNDTRSAQNAIAAAWDSQATGKNSVAVGTGTRATGLSSTAVGDGAQATANGAVALGQSTESAGNSVAAGFNAKARSNNTIAIGVEANNDGSITNNASSVSVGVATRARAVGSMAMGVSADASGKYSLALGSGDVSGDYTDGTNHPSASGEKSIAIGHNSNASDESAIAIGSSSISDKTSATALGRNTTATGVNSSAIGAYSIASATDATALGRNANATAGQSTALGTYSVASGQYGTGVGYQANASGANSTAVGVSAKANKDGASAMGPGARAYGNGAISLGYQALSGANIFNSTNGSFNDASADVTNYAKWGDAAIGLRAIASGGNATALGRSATATAANAIAIGGGNGDSATDNKEKTEATGEKSTAIGYNAKAKTGNDLAVGRGVTSSGGAATALGYYATASGNQTVALGSTINSTAQYATGIGYSVNSQGEGSVAIGAGTDALGAIPAKQVQATAKNAIAIGRATQATSQDATAIGTDATASNTDAIAIGRKSNASGSTSIGFGYNTKSTATNTVAIGTDVSATAESAIALGRKTTASALNATAVGPIANASGKYSSAFGMSAAASKENSLALGTNANASLDKSVALGSDSTTATNATSQGSVVIGGKTITWNGAPTVSGTGMQVSVGSAGAERQIKNVAAGEVSANSTDAINGSQLYAVADALNQANVDQSIKYKANGTGSNSVKLSDGLNFTNGATTTATVGANGQVSFDLNTATQKSITDSATAVARTISLGGDTGTTTAKSLTSSNVNFGVKSGSPTYLTTTANGNDVTLTINEQAIKNAAKDASSFKVKANATAAEDVKGGDTVAFNNGDNIAITQTGKTFKIATAKNVTFDTATIGTNTTIGSTGITTNKVTVGTVSIDGTNGINAGNKAITNVGTGIVANSKADNSNVANIGDVKTIANDAVANLSTSLGVTDGTNSGTVNLKNQSLKVVGTGVAKATVNGQTITVDVAKGTIAANATTGALTGTAGVVDANDMATAVNTAITKAVDTAAGTQKLDISAGGTDSSVNLKTQKLTVAGTGASTASLTGQTITVNVAEGTFTNKTDGTTSATAGVAKATDVAAAINNANTVLGNKITAATQSLSTLGDNKFKLTADSTSTTGQALNKSGGLSFKIAGDGDLVSTSATTDTINVTVKKGTLTNAADGSLNVTNSGVVTADNMKSVVNDAITKAVSSAKDGSAWNISTNGGTATKVSGGNTVDLINGDNIEITQDGTDGKKITVKTKKDLTVDSVTAANTVKVGSATNLITLDGATGGVSGNSFTAGNASMNTTGFRLTGGPSMTTAGIDAGNKQITNLASGGTTATNAANIGDINAAISSLTTNLGKNTTIAYKANNAGGQTVSLADGFNFTNGTLTTAEVAANGVVKFNVTQGSLSTDGNGNITNTTGVATTDDVKNAVNTAITKAVDNATGTQKLDISAGGTDSSVNLKTQKLTVAGTGAATASLNGQTITVDVAEGTFTNKSDGTTSATAGVAKAADVASAINNANTALSQKITDATTSLGTLGNNTFTLKADSTDTTAQALNKSGGLAFKVAGDGDLVSTSATTDTVKVTVKKGELSNAADGSLNVTDSGVVTADNMKTVVNDAITKAVTSAKDGSAWNISTNGGTATKVSGGNTVDLINGDNIEITQDGTDGKKITVKTKKDLTVDSVTAGNTVINTSGLTNGTTAITGTGITTDKVTVGGLSIDKTAGINAGNKAITNVGTGIVANSNADNSNVANIGDVKTIANDAVANLSTNLGVTDGTNNGTVNLKTEKLKVVGTGAATTTVNGQTVTVDVAKGTLAANAATGALTGTAGVVDANDMATAVNTAITKAVDNATGTQALKIGGDTTATGSVNLKSDTLSVKGDNKFITTAASGNDITLTVNEQAIKTAAKDAASFKVKANSEAEQEVKGGETVVFNDGDNIEITQTGKTFKIATSKNVTFDTATIGGNTTIGSTGITTNKVTVGGISIDGTNGINAGSKQITNVASGGTTATNAANIGDINAAISSLTTNLGKNTTIAYKANNAGGQTVSLADGFNFTNGTLTTAEVAANGVVKFNVTQGSLSTDGNGNITNTTGVATTDDVKNAVNTAITKAVDNATGTQKLDISAGGTDSSVNLKTQKLTVAGTGAATASLNGQTITVDVAEGTFTNKSDGTTSATAGVAKAADVASAINNANTALSQKITDATTSLGTLGNNTFTLKADSTDTTAQALNKSGGLAFKVAGDGDLVSTSATTDTVKVTVKKGELSNAADGSLNVTDSGVVTADNMKTVVNDAITKAVTSAKDGSAWNISTNGGTATKVSGGNTVDLINGDNIEITQDGTDGKKITVKTKKDLTLDSVTAANTVKVGSGTNLITLDGTTGGVSGNSFTAGNASMNTTGFRVTGGPSVTTAGIDAGGKQITNMISGGTVATNAATIGDVNTKVTTAINDLTTNLTKNTNIAYTANTATPGQTVSLKDGFNFTNGTLTTAEVAANGVVKFNVTQGSLSTDGNGNITNTTGVATTDDVKNAVNTAITKAVDNATGTQKLDISAGGTDSSVNLKTQKLTVAGTGAATASLNGQTITVDVAEGTFTNKSDGTTSATAGVAKAADVASAINNANTALSQKITDATTSLGTLGNNTFTLKADSTDTTAQALNKSGGLAFKVAGDGDLVSTSATTDTVKVTVKKGELSNAADGSLNVTDSGVVTADNMKTVVNDAITKAVTSAKDGSAWNISTNGGTATKVSGGNTVDLINGDNIEITQDGTDGKKITVKTKKDLTLDSVTAANTVKVGSGTNLITLDGTTGGVSGNSFTAGNASMNTTGFRVTGGPSVTTAGIDAGGKQITNMISGGTVATNAATIGDVNTKVTTAINDLTTNLTKNTNIAYTANTATPGQTVSLKDGFNFTNGTLTTAEVAANGVVKFNVTQGSLSTDGNGNITNTTGVATTDDVKNAVNTAITKAVDNATGTQKLDISAGGTDSSVNLKTQKLTVAGTGAATASLNGQTITVDVAEGTFTNKSDGTTSATAGVAKAADVASAINNANTALSQKITDATTSLGTLGNNTFTLKADSTDTTAQALNKSGGLAFKVAGDGDLVSTSATTDTVKVTVKKGELSNAADGSLNVTDSGVVTADNMKTVVNDAITKAVTSAKDGSAWNISTNGGTATKVSGGNTVDLINGDNIEITQDGTDGKKITVKTKKDLTLDSVTAANTVKVGSGTNLITLDGATGGVSGNTFTAGNASMNTTGFRLTGGPSMTTTGIDAGNKVITNVASGGTTSTNAANIGDITKAISDLTTNLTKNTSISYTANTATPGQTVSLKDGFNFTNGTLTTAEVAANGVVKFNVTQGSLSTDGNGNITNTAGVATTDDVKNAVNTAINKAVTNSSTAVNTLGANTFTLTGDNSTSTTGQALNKNGGLSFKVAGDGNFITTSAATDTVTVSIKQGTFGSNTDGTAKSTTNGVATTNDVANIVNTTVTNAVTKATGSQVLNITDGTNNDSINLKNDTLKVVGADGVTTAVSGKTITVGLDTATKDKINNASTATNKNISLAADTGNASSQSLKDGDVSFAVKGATGDYISTNMNGSTVEISTKRATIDSNATTGQASVTGNDGLATAKNVADAINAATAKAVSQSAWKLAADGTTGTETISGGDTVNFKAGSNMEVSRTGKDITYKTKDNVAFTTVTAGTGANEVKLDGNTGTVTAKDITATGDVTAKNVTTSGNVTAAGTVKGDTVQGNTVKAGNVTITGGTTNTITGLSNTTWTGSTTTPDRAATEGQLQQAISSATSSATFKFDGDNNSQQTMNLQNGTFKVTGDTMITTNATSAGIGLSLNTNNVKIAYAANGTNGQTTSIASGLNFTDGDHTKATVAASGVVKYDAKTSTISVANGHAAASGNDLATADNVADAINQMTQNNAGNTTQLRQEISKVATETQRVGAHAAAMAALKPIQYDPLAPTQIMAGVGNYRGESAAALGIAHYTNDNTMFNVGVSVGGNHNMINAGVTHKFGISAEKKNIPDRYKAGPISSIYVMQDEMTQLRSENEAYKAKLDKQQSEIDALKAAVDQLLASKA